MGTKQQVAPSILSADFSRLGEEAQAVERAGADRIHIDVMDGHFVPNLTAGACVVKSLKQVSSLPLDVHLMVNEPEKMIPAFAAAGADSLIIHLESTRDPAMVLKQIHQEKVLTGLTLKPETAVEKMFPFLPYLDLILIMTVEPGFGGQSLLPDQVEKISIVKKELSRHGLNHPPVHVDGGVSDKTRSLLLSADVLVSGSFIFRHKDYKTAISLLKTGIK